METTKKTFDPKKIEEQRFEFILYINNHIICQRYFNIRDFNEHSVKSVEMKELMDAICNVHSEGRLGIIPNFLKRKAEDLLWTSYNPFSQPYEQPKMNNYEKIVDFQCIRDYCYDLTVFLSLVIITDGLKNHTNNLKLFQHN